MKKSKKQIFNNRYKQYSRKEYKHQRQQRHQYASTLEELADVHRHLVNLSAVVLFNIPQDMDVVCGCHVNGNTFAAC